MKFVCKMCALTRGEKCVYANSGVNSRDKFYALSFWLSPENAFNFTNFSNDGWERQFNEINSLKGIVCAMCEVRNCVRRETAETLASYPQSSGTGWSSHSRSSPHVASGAVALGQGSQQSASS